MRGGSVRRLAIDRARLPLPTIIETHGRPATRQLIRHGIRIGIGPGHNVWRRLIQDIIGTDRDRRIIRQVIRSLQVVIHNRVYRGTYGQRGGIEVITVTDLT